MNSICLFLVCTCSFRFSSTSKANNQKLFALLVLEKNLYNLTIRLSPSRILPCLFCKIKCFCFYTVIRCVKLHWLFSSARKKKKNCISTHCSAVQCALKKEITFNRKVFLFLRPVYFFKGRKSQNIFSIESVAPCRFSILVGNEFPFLVRDPVSLRVAFYCVIASTNSIVRTHQLGLSLHAVSESL